ncbi:MAG: type II/IV secretion system protein [Alphaproteobacteria bacterium]|nr:type II/IV secretion system protein [Alphaproteobacteria bacterium]
MEAKAAAAAGGNRMGDKLVALGLITTDQLEVALHEKRRSNKMLGNVLVDLGFVAEATLTAILAERTGSESFDPTRAVIDPAIATRLPKEVAVRHKVLLIGLDQGTAHLAMADPYDVLALDVVRRYLPPDTETVPLVCPESILFDLVDRAYGAQLSIDGMLREIQTGEFDPTSIQNEHGRYLHPVVRLINALLLDAARQGASDLHFEPEGNFIRLRYRIDGVMLPIRAFHVDYWGAMSQRLKLMSGMNIAETRMPQDGRFTLFVANREVDFRVSSMPTVFGENIVLRVLDHVKALRSLSELGFSPQALTAMERMLRRPEGILVVTGPTGSGKTTTLYAMLNKIKSVELNIKTLEDPVEYKLGLVRQTQVREASGLTFAEGIRAMLRQDPDILFIGEVRDPETAQMALRASMTGHQVFSTVHTNDAVGVVARLIDLGMPIGMMAGNIIGSMSQRLTRVLCVHCKEMGPATAEECQLLGVDPAHPPVIGHARHGGCPECRHTGYRGRVAIAEVIEFTPEIDELVVAGATRGAILDMARRQGFISIVEDGIGKVLAGETSVAALSRAVHLVARNTPPSGAHPAK